MTTIKPLPETETEKKDNAKKGSSFWHTVRTFVIGFSFGAIVIALVLDNRAGAMYKAFFNPIAINGAQLTAEVQTIKN